MIEPQLIYIQIQDKCFKLNKKYPEYYSYISRQSNSVFKIFIYFLVHELPKSLIIIRLLGI